jgi:hypothetical protein
MRAPYTDPDGNTFTFDHLNPFDATVSVTVEGRRYIVPITLVFSNHCFTNGKDNTISMDHPLYILTDKTGHRIFSHGRHQESLTLPDRMREVIAAKGHCFKLDKEGSYIHIHDPQSRDKFAGWYIYFKFDQPKAGETVAIRVSITSHHYRQGRPKELRLTMSVKFPALAALWLRSRPDNLARCEQVPDDLP